MSFPLKWIVTSVLLVLVGVAFLPAEGRFVALFGLTLAGGIGSAMLRRAADPSWSGAGRIGR